eukprot:GCRY01002563.1.p1 GENE.GCRY01002563.1~~GCRY01002563.1.p1  ORF type:complete len:513 (-),score=123.83 GCRY01002563.1:327-1865(-)
MDQVQFPEGLIDTDDSPHDYQYDLLVIGGGSGGLAAAKAAAKLGVKVAMCDFVKPSTQGNTWGIGGTCVNVGCIPKKLFHQAALIGEDLEDASSYGWKVDKKGVEFDWDELVNNIQDHIGSTVWNYKVQLRKAEVDVINGYASFTDPHSVEITNASGKRKTLSARRFIIAVGGRPSLPDLPGVHEHCVTSDDIFSLMTPPGKTCVVGASYVALECAGFLTALGFDVTVMVRSILLRGFDQECAKMIGDFMEEHKTKFMHQCVPQAVDKTPEGKLRVRYKIKQGGDSSEVTEGEELFDTVLYATGRTPQTEPLNLDVAGVRINPKTKKIITRNERTTAPHIYAIGDAIESTCTFVPELTPTAIKAGQYLIERLYNKSHATMSYHLVPTTIFTPLEYGTVGLTEDAAIEKYGEENIRIYHGFFTPLEWTVPHRGDNKCFHKLICLENDRERIVGFHLVGPHAGEVTQGFGVAMMCGATKREFDMTVGIHPTNAEVFTTMAVTKDSGEVAKSSGC